MRSRTVAGIGLAFVLAASTAARAQTVHLPITDFTHSPNNLTSVQSWLDPETGYIIVFDAFGHWNSQFSLGLNTQLGGQLSIHDQGDGTERVVLVLHTKDALCYGTAGGSLAFGRTLGQVRLGAAASLGDGLFRLEFTKAVGAPMPNWQGALGAQNDAMATASISCKGELRANAITGYVDGQPGFAHTTQTGLFDTGANAGIGCPPEQDANCFPSEKVQFKASGRKD
jgi:hypothetical protein